MEKQTASPQSTGAQVYILRKMPRPEMDLNVRFNFLDRPACPFHTLRLQASFPLEGAWISSNFPIHFLISKAASYEITTTVSEAEQKLGNKFSATLRFKPNCASAEFSFCPVAGCSGILEIFVSAVNSTGRCTQREVIPIKPLNLYRQIDAVDQKRSYNVLHVKGTFSPLTVRSWMENLFQNMQKSRSETNSDDQKATLSFESRLLGSHLQCEVRDGEILFQCENPTTTAIIMQFLSRQATQERIKLDIRPKISSEACMATLLRIDTVLTSAAGQSDLKNLNSAVSEINAAEGSDLMLHPLFRSKGWKKLQSNDSDVDIEPSVSIDYVHALILDLMKDYAKLRGKSVVQRLPEVLNMLHQGSAIKSLQEFAAVL